MSCARSGDTIYSNNEGIKLPIQNSSEFFGCFTKKQTECRIQICIPSFRVAASAAEVESCPGLREVVLTLMLSVLLELQHTDTRSYNERMSIKMMLTGGGQRTSVNFYRETASAQRAKMGTVKNQPEIFSLPSILHQNL